MHTHVYMHVYTMALKKARGQPGGVSALLLMWVLRTKLLSPVLEAMLLATEPSLRPWMTFVPLNEASLRHLRVEGRQCPISQDTKVKEPGPLTKADLDLGPASAFRQLLSVGKLFTSSMPWYSPLRNGDERSHFVGPTRVSDTHEAC